MKYTNGIKTYGDVMSTKYVPITKDQIEASLCDEMGFSPVESHTTEMVYERPVITTSGKKYPYRIRVYSSILKRTGISSEKRKGAIEVILIDEATQLPPVESETRIHRTKNAMDNLRNRCRSAFRRVLETEKCPKCGAMLVQRESKKTGKPYMVCSRFIMARSHCRRPDGPDV